MPPMCTNAWAIFGEMSENWKGEMTQMSAALDDMNAQLARIWIGISTALRGALNALIRYCGGCLFQSLAPVARFL